MTLVAPPPAIIAHRGNVAGPSGLRENSFGLCAQALALGFGLETDLRRSPANEYYLSHDPAALSSENALVRFAALFRQYPEQTIAVNVKELGYEDDLVRLHRQQVFGSKSFYFDFELLERKTPGQAQRLIRALSCQPAVPLAARVSDRGESIEQCLSIPAEVVWADEFETNWLTGDIVGQLRSTGRQVYVVSPELHGRGEQERCRRWADFKEWRVDGICTDYSIEASVFFR